uniref:Uncharacterized protein n=1 Tax=Anopheles melas TaxID=34690 RepID=A0A182TIJ1_9DIPT
MQIVIISTLCIDSEICSKLLPFVSGIQVRTKVADATQQQEKNHMHECIPSCSTAIGKYLTTRYATPENSSRQKVTTEPRIFGSRISVMIMNGTIPMPMALMKTSADMLATGTHRNQSTSTCIACRKVYVPIVVVQTAQPSVDTTSSTRRPAFSTVIVETYEPMSCSIATTIEDMAGLRFEWDSWKILSVYVISGMEPEPAGNMITITQIRIGFQRDRVTEERGGKRDWECRY